MTCPNLINPHAGNTKLRKKRKLQQSRAPTCGHLMSQPTTPAVDHHTHLALVVNAHLFGCIVIVDLIYHLDLSIVIPCSQCPKLQHKFMLVSQV